MTTATKRKRKGGARCAAEVRPADPLETTNDAAISRMKPKRKVPRRSRTKVGGSCRESDTRSADTNGHANNSTLSEMELRGRSKTRGKGDCEVETGKIGARPAENNGRAIDSLNTRIAVHGQAADGGEKNGETEVPTATVCRQLIPLQRARSASIRMRVRIDNGIGSFVASQLGDNASLEDKERQQLRAIADDNVRAIWKGKPLKNPEYEAVFTANSGIIEAAGFSSSAFQAQIDFYGKQMERLVKTLPLADWLEQPEQHGIGLQSIGAILGECGDLRNYPNPSCVWKRMGCAPYQGKMPATWRSGKEGKASAEDWVAMGYNPRRRSLMYVIGEGIVKQNGEGPYRKRYDEAKVTFAANHPDYSKGRVHSHAMLMASKLLLKNLWIQMQ